MFIGNGEHVLSIYTFNPDNLSYPEGVAKSGDTYNHKKLWQSIKSEHRYENNPYNYFPRGRVDINSKRQPIIYINPNIHEPIITQIKLSFGLMETEPVIRYDHSEHYKCYLDDGWKADK